MEKNMKKTNAKKPSTKSNKNNLITVDVLVMVIIVSAILITLVGFVTYNFGYDQANDAKAKADTAEEVTEEEINKEFAQLAEQEGQAMEDLIDKYANVHDVVTNDTYHESEAQYDLNVFKKDYPLIDYSGIDGCQIIITTADGASYVCPYSEIIRQYADCLYTYITPYDGVGEVQQQNRIDIYVNDQFVKEIRCQRLYFTSQEFRDSFISGASQSDSGESAETE